MAELKHEEIISILEELANSDFRIRIFDEDGNKGRFMIYGISYEQSTTEIYIAPDKNFQIETEIHNPAMVLTTSRREEFDQRINFNAMPKTYVNLFFSAEKFIEHSQSQVDTYLLIHSNTYKELWQKVQ